MPKRNKKGSIVVYVFSFLSLVFVIILFYLGIIKIDLTSPSSYKNTSSLQKTGDRLANRNLDNDNYYTNSKVHISGIVYKIPYNLKVGVGFKLNQNGKEFFVKSDKFVLDNFVNQFIEGSGEVVGFYTDNTPVINITSIKQSDVKEESNNKNNTQFISYSGLKIDLEGTEYSILKTGDLVYIVDYYTGDFTTGNKYLKISVFKCEKVNSNYCDSLLNQAKSLRFKNMVSDNGVDFYQIPETNTYFVLNTEYGYYITPQKGDIFNFINFILLEDTKSKKIEAIKNTCKNDSIALLDILKIVNTGNNYEVIGFDTGSNKIICSFKLEDVNGTYFGELKKLKFYNQNANINSDKIDENKYLKYKSRAYGYTLYMPKSVKYKVDIVKENFGISGLDCRQLVNISDFKEGNLSSPDLKIYYCKTSLEEEDVEKFLVNKKGNYIVYKKSGGLFIMEYFSPKGERILTKVKLF